MGLESWPTGKPQCPFERTSELIQIQGLWQIRHGFSGYQSGGRKKPPSWIVASKRAQADRRRFRARFP
jgi:hypothetical protein